MLARHHHPIVAIATAPGRGGVGIVRLSGQRIAPVVQALCGRKLSPRQATYLPFRDAHGQIIDKGLAIFFPAPHSYTGEDVLELQAHGGPVVLQLLLARCLEAGAALDPATGQPVLAQLRVAEPGEFTERAFLNDKIDLAQAEAIADLIDASTETAARSAARSMSGEFSQAVNTLLEQLIHLRMLVEATLDFPEEDIDFLQQADAQGQLLRLQATLASVLARATQGAILREGIKVVIAGQPNVGKSSLLNALAGAELAIVTPVAGTTRDKVSQLIQIEGVPLHVVDTAGLREALDEVEKIGIQRAWTEIESADAVLFLHDLARHDATENPLYAINYIADDARLQSALALKLPKNTAIIDVWNKSDMAGPELLRQVNGGVLISAKTGAGLQALREQLLRVVGWQAAPEGVFMARERHVSALRSVQIQLLTAQNQLQAAVPALDLLAEDLRQAQLHLSSITGAFNADDLLGEIFSKFCIGK
ncbi:tRNA uridine-5-carboxymethylaminomethyl(34) synthesis GTPase MnmE [Polaromonas naphthalenivorans]|uniref:tRNA modification GTPase MnmE n=1 Tax=Polaromonas naphthalenivorans (strain CJ2) TaxID=365044 RepID=MNME_POLNA|nr:tRNA uridine-5-carboxymethylaminomethyl(34) synthesis GTPase MnmE [Polaromonas naphthalenivorans]A1VUS4.1 RecName: Full=tRNA modification GTPase MnmE [Polaromonas naphthalenivorans CJ2]ABM39402.1 tRNA modification GTPase trmE [Polaromonas naphthalenivorans CJ2]